MNINLEEFKLDYINYMLAEEMMIKYGINRYYFKKLKKILNLNRGAFGKLDYVLKINAVEVIKPNEELIKPKTKPNIPNTKPNIPNTKPNIPNIKPKIPNTKPKMTKSTINIKSINTDEDINITEVKKCDTTYNNDKSELIKLFNKTDETLKKSKQVLNKKK
jgi:hypothetical protein